MSIFDDDETPAEARFRELHLDDALGERIGDDPLLEQARENVAETAERAKELRDVEDGPSSGSG